MQPRRHQPPPAEAFIFDLDGTLTIPQLDFEAMREEMGIAGGPLLEEIERLDVEAAALASNVLESHVERAARTAALQPRARQVFTELRRRRLPTALLTRNSPPISQYGAAPAPYRGRQFPQP